jgi:hypothetical protein
MAIGTITPGQKSPTNRRVAADYWHVDVSDGDELIRYSTDSMGERCSQGAGEDALTDEHE